MISVVMPVYNQVKFVEEAIKSILNQTYANFELILVDDGSNDGSTKILESCAKKEDRVRYFRKENGGTGSALNLGFSHAKGKYGTWVSSDNIYYPAMFKTLTDTLKRYEKSRFVFSSFSLNGKYDWVPPNNPPPTGILIDFLFRSRSRCITGICFMFEMSLKNECGDYVLVPGEDYAMGVLMGTKTDVVYISTPFGLWRDHPDSVTRKMRAGKLKVHDSSGRTANMIAIDILKGK